MPLLLMGKRYLVRKSNNFIFMIILDKNRNKALSFSYFSVVVRAFAMPLQSENTRKHIYATEKYVEKQSFNYCFNCKKYISVN